MAAAGLTGALVVGMAAPALAAAPANDPRSGAVHLTLGTSVTGTTLEATLEPGEVASVCPIQFGGDGGNTVWYRYTNPTASTVSIVFHMDSATDQGIAIWNSTGTTELKCSDRGLGGTRESAATEVAAGQSVLVSVYRFTAGDEGPFALVANEGDTRPFVNGVLTSDPAAVDFGPVPVGTGVSRDVAYTNSSGAPAEVAYELSGGGAFNLGPGTTCGFSQQGTMTIPAEGCNVEWTFSPMAAGPQALTVTFPYRNAAGAQDMSTTLQGEGVDDQPPPEIPEAPLALLLPGSTLLFGTGIYLVRRRRNRAAMVASD